MAALVVPTGLRAQSACMLVPVPLAQRVQQAALVVEARVASQQAERLPNGHLATRHVLQVFKVFKGQLPGQLSLLTPGGTLGLARETVSSGLGLGLGQQGIFLLEADPASPGSWRAYAGPQGFIAYDLAAGTATEPFGTYPAIGPDLYPALAGLTGRAYRTVQPNTELAAAPAARLRAQRVAVTPTISGFSPAAATAGTSTANTTSSTGILTINGSGFNAARGAGYVLFRNADNPGTTTQPLADDYLGWSDTQIRVRVPSASQSGNVAGTGPVQVVNSDGNAATTATSLTVTYALTNVTSNFGGTNQNYAIHLVGTGTTDNPGGYVLHYAASMPAAARPPFVAALTSWRCQAGANRSLGAATQNDAASRDGENVVRFGTLPAGVLGQALSYYTGCVVGGVLSWELIEMDYTFSTAATWNFATTNPGTGQSDFQSVALHELGHGIQLSHIISSTGVMNYALTNGTTRRTLDADTDLAAAQAVTAYSTSATQYCDAAFVAYAPVASGNCTLPVELTDFAATYTAGQGTALHWATASEQQSAYFALESQEGTAPDAWQELSRLPAAGSSAQAHQYAAFDARPLAGLRYYRLRQVDQDGTVAYSPTVAVQGAAATLVAYPNPASGTVQLSGPAATQVCLLDATGRRVRQQAWPVGQAEARLSLAGLPAGLYVVEWQGRAGTLRTRLVVE